MGFRFWRRIKIAPGVTLNLSKSGGSLSFGPRGAKFTVGGKGKRVTVGLPGTGLYYTTKLPEGGSSRIATSPVVEPPTIPVKDRLSLGFFKRLLTPDDEEALIDGSRELALGNEDMAFECLKKATHLADGAYLAGFLALRNEQFDDAEKYLNTAEQLHDKLGHYFSKYGISAIMTLPITEEVTAYVQPDIRGVLLALVEIYQLQEKWEKAIACLERLKRLEPDDVLVKLSIAELLLGAHSQDKSMYHKIIQACEGVENDTPIHTALLLYKAKALRGLGLLEASLNTLTSILRKKKDRSDDLLMAIRYERALAYEEVGQQVRARNELEKLYSEAPDYEDVASRLKISG